jgi:sugar lactone lactonase YvrE
MTVTPASVPTILFGPSNPPTPPSGAHTRDVIIPFTVTDTVGVASVSPQPVFVADIGTSRVDRVDPGNGSVVNVYTGGNHFSPIAVAVSPANGKLYVSEDDQRRILRMDQTGLNLEVVYDASTAVAPNNPDEAIGLAFAPNGDLFFTTAGSGATYGLWKIAAGALGTPPVQLFTIPNIGTGQGIGLTFAPNSDLFIVDQSANQVLKSSPPYASASAFVGPASLPTSTSRGDVNGVMLPFCLFGVAVNASGDVFVAHSDAKAILRFDSAGTSLGTFASVGPSEAPVFIQFDATGNLWVAAIDPAAFQSQTAAPGHVYRIASNGVVSLAAGRPFLAPLGVALSPTTGNTVYCTVAFTSTSPGAVVTATNTGGQSANVTSPGVTIDKSIPGSFVVVNTNEAGEGSLRQAILNANAHAGVDTISFNIQPPGVQTIAPIGTLPFVTDPAVLDATTQPGWALGAPVIEVSGANAGPRASGLSIAAGNSTIRGFVVNRWTRQGIELRNNGNNTVAGNFIGTIVSGNGAAANQIGVYVESPNNIIAARRPPIATSSLATHSRLRRLRRESSSLASRLTT